MVTVSEEKKTLGEFLQIVVIIAVLFLVIRYGIIWAQKKDGESNKNVFLKVNNAKTA